MRFFLFLPLLFLFSCTESQPTEDLIEKKLTLSEKLKFTLSSDRNILNGITEEERLFLDSIYSNQNYHPLWLKENIYVEMGTQILHYYDFPEQIGIPKKRYDSLLIQDSLLRNELKLSLFIAHSFQDVYAGFLDSSQTQFAPKKLISVRDFELVRSQMKSGISIDSIYFSVTPTDTNYRKMWLALNSFCKTKKLEREDFEIPSQKKDSVAAWQEAEKALRIKGYLKSLERDSLVFALKQFQKDTRQKVDGIIGESTAEILGESDYSKILRTCLNLEKIRNQEKFPSSFVWINIPSFTLSYFYEDTLRSKNRVVVGTYKNQTPTLKSSIHSIVALPYWNVPYSIASKEILPAVQRNVAYLARNNMKVFQQKKEIDPQKINWKKYSEKSFPFQIRQEPGPNNSLGIIKFEFHNKYSVYVHDSPAKSLFGTIHRSYSHGCIRCENPVELGKMILTFDENPITVDSLDSIYARNEHTLIPLKKRIPIYVVYQTVQVNDQHELEFLRDFYRKEHDIIQHWRN